ncbi:helical cell shape controlling family carboxypeptidase [Thermovibrio guaymasensis]|uniref:Helical cell shape controlling family carboxypeptidase n=1 Tax=Thermovibrio guaymasensis TaxID=240167 RepID=A0A420W5M7_9BACT|nr:M14/M99 family metallopeptidase [Thermovibrio guaymasensis]RKQ60328.1 helical cell shape controlling family carboxypeptidase [Thermovibrio guaymasensis]
MENYRRREFIKLLGIASFLPILKWEEALAGRVNAVIELPPLPFQESLITGEEKGGRILVVGGIHGNEPGAYKAAEILRNLKVKKGEILVAPRTNFVSILTNKRGYNGDMNRKFASISPKDPDYPAVKRLKSLIKDYKPDLLLTLHDGFGFHSLNPKAWGQCIVIDEERYGEIELGREVRLVSERVNRLIKRRKWKIPVFNTHTFSKNTKHPEQRKSLTYFCLKECSVPAVCLEVSKQLPDLYHKVRFHLLMLREFFKVHGVETEPSLDWVIENVEELLEPKVYYSAELLINGRKVTVSDSKTFKIPKGSRVKFLTFNGTGGTNAITEDLNSNLRKVGIRKRISFKVKDDFKELFSIRFIVG